MPTKLNKTLPLWFVLFFLTALSCSSNKVNIVNTPQVDEPYSYPIFLGNDSAYHDFISQHIKFPSQLLDWDKIVSSRVIVNCLYSKDSKLRKTSIPIFDKDTILKKEVEKLLPHLPQSISTTEMPTDVLYILPIVFLSYDCNIYETYSTEAQYPGGKQELKQYVMNTLYRSLGKRSYTQKGTTIVDFTINEKGYPDNITFVESISPKWDAALLNTLEKMPRWIPARVDGKPVKSIGRITIGDEYYLSKMIKSFNSDLFVCEYIDTNILPDNFFTNIFPYRSKVQYLRPVKIRGKELEEPKLSRIGDYQKVKTSD